MHKARLFACVIVGLFLTVATGSSVSQSSTRIPSENGAAGVIPVLRMEKPRYVEGEAIRFWVGVRPKNSTVIPYELWNPCSLSITKPDGARRVESVAWPVDGMLDHGWSGGWGFGEEKVGPGRYLLVLAKGLRPLKSPEHGQVTMLQGLGNLRDESSELCAKNLECAGEKTPPLELIVERSEILDQIKAEFRFEREGAVTRGNQVPVVLAVQNNSQAIIRFPHRGAMMEGVSLTIVRKEPALQSALFFPWEKLSHSSVMPDTYTWDVASEIPSVVLQPGEHFQQRFLLGDAYSFDQAGDYEIRFDTVLSVLVGEKNGEFADLCPIRLPVTASAKFVLSSAE
jgi:hypothetical protein